ncbi:MAG: peptide chain release factor N(5)-glutamine methyltransferase [Cryomorphaceae bacterium]|nr:peptide chain release factor N(5)-glutamine methyltransferase [Cryomorphaceae bacterium]
MVNLPGSYSTLIKKLESNFDRGEVRALLFLFWSEKIGDELAHKFLRLGNFLPAPKDFIAFDDFANALLSGIPHQYVLGKTTFGGLTFGLNNHVLIPRPETEELMYILVEMLTSAQFAIFNPDYSFNHPFRLLDIGTGSGCLPVSLKHHLPNAWSVFACDIDESVLKLAEQNAKLNKTEVEFFRWDALNEPFPKSENYQAIVSNPPYIPEREKSSMESTVLEHEPHLALFVPNDDPLCFYRQISLMAEEKLVPSGILAFEVHYDGAIPVADLLSQRTFTDIEIRKDIQGHDRFVFATKSRKIKD